MSEFNVIDPVFDFEKSIGFSMLSSRGHVVMFGEDALSVARSFVKNNDVLCFDVRKLFDAGIVPEDIRFNVTDVDLLYDGDGDLSSTARMARHPAAHLDELEAATRAFEANIRAGENAQLDRSIYTFDKFSPAFVAADFYRARANTIAGLMETSLSDDWAVHDAHTFRTTVSLWHMEKNGIRVDRDMVTEMLKREQLPHVKTFLRKMLPKNGDLLRTRFNAVGTRTGRIGVSSGFPCTSIPHGPPREAIVSRFEDGQIIVCDFNAIDYRCIVREIGGSLAEFYGDCDDFHTRTASILFGDEVDPLRRKVIKQVTYTYIYGGSEETLSKTSGLSIGKVKDVITKLDTKLWPIKMFRKKLFDHAMVDGFVNTPDERKVIVKPDDHEGKVLGLFAQTCSSDTCAKALRRIEKELRDNEAARLIFAVYDELVIDAKKDFHSDSVRRLMEDVTGFKVDLKDGASYAQATAD